MYLVALIPFLPFALGAPALVNRAASPTVTLSYATVVGSSSSGVDSFKGIPYAQPPTGQLRLKPPERVIANLGTVQATGVPQACPQFYSQVDSSSLANDIIGDILDTPFLQEVTDAGEDCLTVNVQRPSTAQAGSALPVVFWIFGGGFEFGSTQLYDGTSLISTSVSQSKDIIYVSVNYRIGGFGFLPGAEILADGSSNLGLLDQRLALEWVADNIALFGGDPAKVTIWGESAGSISVFDQMALYNGNNTYNGKPLFRAGIMDSGSIVPADPVDGIKGQAVYDTVVENAGCSGASNTLTCLRSLNYTTFLNAANSVPAIFSYSSVALSYLPRPDGTYLTASPEILVQDGHYAQIPFIIGDQEDEGTLFSLFQENITTTADLVNYLQTEFFPNTSQAVIEGLVDTYPSDASDGSPFDTGILYELYPQYKRIAALLGDASFTLARRAFLSSASSVYPSVSSWSYLGTYDYGLPYMGTCHGSDILTTYGITPGFASASIQSYYISFVNTLNPNTGTTGLTSWPQWSQGNILLNFSSGSNTLLADSFRATSYDYLVANIASFHI